MAASAAGPTVPAVSDSMLANRWTISLFRSLRSPFPWLRGKRAPLVRPGALGPRGLRGQYALVPSAGDPGRARELAGYQVGIEAVSVQELAIAAGLCYAAVL